MILALSLLFSTAQAECSLPTTARDIAHSVADVEAAFVGMDINAFNEAEARTIGAVECLEDALTPYDAAGIHRASALRSFIVRDLDTALASYAAALAAQPNYNLPVSIAPEGNSLYTLYQDARPMAETPPDRIAQSVPRGTVLLVDGRRSQMRPIDRPAVVQLVDLKGSVLWSGYIPSRGIEPDFSGVDVPTPDPAASQASGGASIRTGGASEPRQDFRIESRRRPTVSTMSSSTKTLVTAASGALAAAAVLYGAASASADKYQDRDTDYNDLKQLRSRTNGLVIASTVTGGIGLGLGAYAYITW